MLRIGVFRLLDKPIITWKDAGSVVRERTIEFFEFD